MIKKEEKPQRNKAKTKLLIIVAVIFSLLVVLIIASLLIDMYESSKEPETTDIDFDFYEADYDEDIFLNEEYNEIIKGGFISYKNNDVTIGISRENAHEYGSEVEFIVEFLYDIIYGDNQSYNARFSSEYYKTNARKDSFTMQMIYDAKISHVSTETVDTETGSYTKYVYSIEYRIYRNNGTYRRDIGNGAKMQYITVTDRTGKLLIDELVTPSYR